MLSYVFFGDCWGNGTHADGIFYWHMGREFDYMHEIGFCLGRNNNALGYSLLGGGIGSVTREGISAWYMHCTFDYSNDAIGFFDIIISLRMLGWVIIGVITKQRMVFVHTIWHGHLNMTGMM